MEARKIIIIDSKNQSQKSFMSTATTLGALKAELSENNISYSGCSFYCGEMRAELVDDAAPIPETVMYKGESKRDLTFMLTTTNKKIRSGAMSRLEIYGKIKELNLQEVCKAKYGKNFTMCSTVDLIRVIDEATKKEEPKVEPKVEKKEEPKNVVQNTVKYDCNYNKLKEAIEYLADALYDEDCINDIVYQELITILDSNKPQEKSDRMSQREINDMFDFVK